MDYFNVQLSQTLHKERSQEATDSGKRTHIVYTGATVSERIMSIVKTMHKSLNSKQATSQTSQHTGQRVKA